MTTLGVDASDNQSATLPWPEWYARGWRVAVLRAAIGFRPDAHFARYVIEAYRAGFIVAAYHAILGHQFYDPVRQAEDFLELVTSQVSLLVLDDEAPGVSADDVAAFVARVTARTALPLVLYGNWNLAVHMATRPALYALPVWWAGYPTAPLPTTEPPWPRPRNVPPALRVAGWQYAGDNGRLPPYTGPIDLSQWYEVPGQPAPAPPPDPLATGVAIEARAILELL